MSSDNRNGTTRKNTAAQPSRMDHGERVGGRSRLLRACVFFGSAWVLLAVGCDEAPTDTAFNDDEQQPGATPNALASLRCTVDVAEESFSCAPSSAAQTTEGGLSDMIAPQVIVGNQERYVRLTSSGLSTVSDTLSANVTVQNLLLQPLATLNDTTEHPNGVRVFFFTDPTNGVEVANADGVATFTDSEQLYFEYEQILRPGEVSPAKTWRFALNGAATFGFQVFVAAEVPDENAIAISLASIASGETHSCGLDEDGNAFCWGQNNFGQVGDSTFTERRTPTAVSGGLSFTAISTSYHHTCALDADGKAFCWGQNTVGQIGDGSTITRSIPTPVTGNFTFTSISAGFSHTCGVVEAGNAFCWGENDWGKLGDGTGNQQSTPSVVAGTSTFSAIGAGRSHTCALDEDGNALCWGRNAEGELGDSTFTSRDTAGVVKGGLTFAAISAGQNHNCALDGDGKAFCWGWNNRGQIGNGNTSNQFSPTAVLDNLTFSAISGGAEHTCGVNAAGEAFCWGRNVEGQLGDGDETSDQRTTPSFVAGGITFAGIDAGWVHTCGYDGGGIGYCWGENDNDRLGDGRTIGNVNQHVPVFVASTR